VIIVRWGIIGCGDVTEIKSGPGFQKAEGSALVAVMRRDLAKAEDYSRRHGVPRAYSDPEALIRDPEVDAVYIATPPSSHCELALQVAAAGKACLVEKPMAMNHAECLRMVEAFRSARQPLCVAYYRRALPRFVKFKESLDAGSIGRLTAVHIEVRRRLVTDDRLRGWRFDPSVAGGGLFFDIGSHCLDLVDYLAGSIQSIEGFTANTACVYAAEDVVSAAFRLENGAVGTGTWNFNASDSFDQIRLTGSSGELSSSIFSGPDLQNPPHVHQPLIQTIVDELRGRGACPSTGESGARASWAMDRCVGRLVR
jgi:1,5-anhydro-D-fructose reductase (1,5-anhydro-D-mannitol-forming)